MCSFCYHVDYGTFKNILKGKKNYASWKTYLKIRLMDKVKLCTILLHFASSMRSTQNGLKGRREWFLVGVRMYRVWVLNFLIFKLLLLINGLRYRVEILYSSKAVTPRQSWRFLCKLMTNLKFYGIVNFFAKSLW